MSSNSYWRKREEEALEKYKKSEAEYDKEINRIYSDMLDACNKEINAFYGKYAKAEGITLAEAKKRVSKLDIAEYERKAAKYVKDAELDRKANGGKTNKQGYYFSEKANEEMRLYNATMKINRLEMLKANIGLEMIKGHAELETFMGDILKGRTEEELARQAGILGKTIRNNAQLAHAIPNASFHNATFSDRVWLYHDVMKADLEKMLTSGLIQGKNPRQLARELEKYVKGDAKGGAKYNAERLMRTELARVQTEAQKQSFERNGFEEYEFIANSNCCDICKSKDGKHFKVADMMPGENAAPMHPHCRCSTAAYSDREEYNEWLDYLEKGGTTAEWEKKKAQLTKTGKNSIIQSRSISDRKMSSGLRTSPHHILTDDEIASIKTDARSLNIPEEVLRFNEGKQTGFSDRHNVITVRGDILPDLNSENLRDRLSQKAVLAHEYYGHYKHHPSTFRVGDWRDEFRASYRAAIDSPNLSDDERRMLMLDAYDRAKEAGISVEYNKTARGIIYGYNE